VARYLLPCECGQAVPIEVSQAGEKVICPCGRVLEVPALRAVRQLRVAPAESVARVAPSRWTFGHGLAFALGVFLLVAGLLLCAYSYLNQQFVRAQLVPQEEVNAWVDAIDSFSLDDLWAYWSEIRNIGLPSGTSGVARADQLISWLRRLMGLGLAMVVIGGTSIAVAWYLARSRPSQGKRNVPALLLA